MAEVVLKTKMKKYLIAGSKVSRNCFSNTPTGSSLSRQKSSVLINSTKNRTPRKYFCGFLWETFQFYELHFCLLNLHSLFLTVKHTVLETIAPELAVNSIFGISQFFSTLSYHCVLCTIFKKCFHYKRQMISS